MPWVGAVLSQPWAQQMFVQWGSRSGQQCQAEQCLPSIACSVSSDGDGQAPPPATWIPSCRCPGRGLLMVYRQQQAHLSTQLIKPEQGEAPLRGSDGWCELRVPASPLDRSGEMSPPAALVLKGAAQLRRRSQPPCPTMRCCPSTASPLPSSCGCSPSPVAPWGWSLHHWAQQSTGWSSFQSCHFFFISDFTCHGGERESGGFSLAVPSAQTMPGMGWHDKATG